MTAVPWTYTRRPDTGTSTTRLAVWLFLASETMLFASLFSAYALLRTGASDWPDGTGVLSPGRALWMTPLLLAATAACRGPAAQNLRGRLVGSSVAASAFIVLKLADYAAKIGQGLLPSTSLLLACWFTLTGLHALHVAGGAAANLWVAAGAGGPSDRDRERMYALRLYWYFVDLVWGGILVGFHLV